MPDGSRHFAEAGMMGAVARIQALLGGEAVTGALHDERDIVLLVRRGVPTQAVDHFLAAAGLPFNALDPQILSRRTFRRRQKSAQPLDQAESDRLLRLVAIVAAAEETFGETAKAHLWLNRESRILGGETPLATADTDQGARAVEALLGRIAHGIAA
jgi:putative toxin-antitoxin system antitoxin component (TIGR02293 family)